LVKGGSPFKKDHEVFWRGTSGSLLLARREPTSDLKKEKTKEGRERGQPPTGKGPKSFGREGQSLPLR